MRKLSAFKARKSLGQNFLFDKNIIRKIVGIFNPVKTDTVLEIGPGFGALTELLLRSGCNYTGVEIDERLIEELASAFADWANFKVLHNDFRKFNLTTVTKKNGTIRLIGNIPYHITSSIIFTAFAQHELIKDMMLMMQKEVAQRVVAMHGGKEYGILSVISQTYATPEIVLPVPASVFIPKPEIDSAIVYWDFSKPQKRLPVNPEIFRVFVRTVFNQRRKMLRNTLKKLGHIEAFCADHAVDLQRRPEALSVIEIIDLCNNFLPYMHL